MLIVRIIVYSNIEDNILHRVLKNSLSGFAVASALFMLCGCTTFVDIFKRWTEPEKRRLIDPEIAATFFGEPVVRPGQTLKISIMASGVEDSKTGTYSVDQLGKIQIPLIGQIKCEGLTLLAASEKIKEALTEYYQDPQVTVEFVYTSGLGISPWGTITVMGEVSRPGPVDVPPTGKLPLTRVLQMAGGTSPIADTTAIKVSSCTREGIQTRTYVSLVEIGKEGRVDKDMELHAGDVVWVPMGLY